MSSVDFVFPQQKGHTGNTVEIKIDGETVATMNFDKNLSSPQLKMGMVASEILPLMDESGVSQVTFSCPVFIRDHDSWDKVEKAEDYIPLIEEGTIAAHTPIPFNKLDKLCVLDNPEQFLLSDEPNVFIDGTPVFFN